MKKIPLYFLALFTSLFSEEPWLEKYCSSLPPPEQNVTSNQEIDPFDKYKAAIAAYCCNPGDCIIDVGAHIGNYSIYYQKLVGETGLVVSYEANPHTYRYLVDRLSQANIHNVLVRDRAASATTGDILPMKVYNIYHSPEHSGVSTLEPALMNEERMPGVTETVLVETEQLNDLLQMNIPPVRLIKIDVEGHEHAVFKGAELLLRKYRPFVIFEYGYLAGVWEPDTIHQMEEFGYVCYDLKTNKRVNRFYDNSLTDLIAIPEEKGEEFSPAFSILYKECFPDE